MKLPSPSWSWASLPAILIAWMVIAADRPSYAFPQPWDVIREGVSWCAHGRLAEQVAASLVRELAGFAAAVVVSAVIGFTAALVPGFRAFIAPITGIFMALPPIAWAPLALILFGLGSSAIILVIFIASMFPMALALQNGVMSIRESYVRAARILGADRYQLLLHVYLPASLPFLTTAWRIGFSQAWRALVAAEMVGASNGIGWMVAMGGQIGSSSQVLLGIAIIGTIAWVTEFLIFRRIELRYQSWHQH